MPGRMESGEVGRKQRGTSKGIRTYRLLPLSVGDTVLPLLGASHQSAVRWGESGQQGAPGYLALQ